MFLEGAYGLPFLFVLVKLQSYERLTGWLILQVKGEKGRAGIV